MTAKSSIHCRVKSAQPNILVVDDMAENLRLLANLLTEQGYSVRMAPSGPLALMAAQQQRPDLILLDIRMPKMNGYEVCQHLKTNEHTRHIPVIFLSALGKSEEKFRAFEVGGVDYMTKPLQTEEVVARVNHHLQLLELKQQLNQQQELLAKQKQQLQREIRDRKRMELELYRERNQRQSPLGLLPVPASCKKQQGQPTVWHQPFECASESENTGHGKGWQQVQHRHPSLKLSTASAKAELDRQSVEHALQRALDIADAAQLAKTRFLSNISHELRTPLNTILGFVQVLERDLALNPEQKNNLGRIHRSGQYLQSLINNILLLTKLEAKEIEIYNVYFDFWALSQDLATSLKPKAEAKNLAFTVVSTSELPHYVYGDENKIRQILTSLLDHAISFAEAGQVTLRIGANPPDAKAKTAPDQWIIQFEIEDTGAVISSGWLTAKNNLSLQPWIESDVTESELSGQIQQARGLGLHISHEYVRLMGGEMVYVSDRDRGAYFRICIPVTIDPNLRNTSSVNASIPQRPRTQDGSSPTASTAISLHFARELAQLSPDWICELEQAAIRGADSTLEQLIDQLPENCDDLRHHLENATLNFKFDIIIRLIKAARQEFSLHT